MLPLLHHRIQPVDCYFQRRKFWNDDFDPFAVALEKVREEDRGRTQVRSHRRAQSLSPFWAFKSSDTGKTTSNPNQALQTPDRDVKTDYKRNPVNAYISKKQGIKRLFSFTSFGSSSCLRPQIHPKFHLGGMKPRKRR
ncbi:hypothetical protein MLD38_008150 [Melastoma candidum]|uniref:Uncharacterized protein n=1 Tax=Melastoma candidum TaxID=119954 RepID=A0ACB9RV98_9MYRT|nr:hypothetical protein MLD38_008150 [Melastoma candidum]